jgi:hypothetical protein
MEGMKMNNSMEEYLTTKELSARIKMAPGSIRNLVWAKTLKEGIHYVKPTGRKLLFVWSNCQAWLHGSIQPESAGKSLINI